jgi:hypothetical protein
MTSVRTAGVPDEIRTKHIQKSRAIAQAVGRRIPTAATQVP